MANKKKFNNQEAADYLRIQPNTLEVWRSKHKGPRYSNIGSRVVYDLDDLEAFFASRAINTRDTAPERGRGK